MIKISGVGSSAKQVARHLGYIGRRGKLELETDDGRAVSGHGAYGQLVQDWDLDLEGIYPAPGQVGRVPKLVHNIVFSMPPGTPPAKLLAAVKAFAREEFALKHRYALALHIDEPHPHVHLVVKATSEQGRRLNPSPRMLREWRSEFAQHLRIQGVPANATHRVTRGVVNSRKRDGIFRAARRGESTYYR